MMILNKFTTVSWVSGVWTVMPRRQAGLRDPFILRHGETHDVFVSNRGPAGASSKTVLL